MTFTELIAEIKWEAKLEQDTTWDAHLLLLIWDEMVQIASLQNEASLYVSQLSLTGADQGVDELIELPPLIKIDRIEFLHNDTSQVWILPDRNETIPPVPVAGQCRCYELVQGTPPSFKLALIPPQDLDVTFNEVLLSYWKIPDVPTGGDTIFPTSWIQSLKTNCIRRALIFNASTADKQADMFAQILAKAEAVSDASNKSLDTIEDEKKPS